MIMKMNNMMTVQMNMTDDTMGSYYNRLLRNIQGGPERTQHLRSLISKKSWTKAN